MVVRELAPWRSGLLVALAVLAVFLAAFAGWAVGRAYLLEELIGDGDASAAGLLQRLADENRAMRDELAIMRNGGELSREVEERVRVDNRGLQDRVAELEQAVAAYRRIGFPDAGGKGLRVQDLAVSAAEGASRWRVAATLVRTGGTDSTVRGEVEGTLLANGPEGRVVLPLAELLPAGRRAFAVRYVSAIDLELQLPPATVPVRLDLVVVLSEPRQDRVLQTWQPRAARAQGGTGHAGQE